MASKHTQYPDSEKGFALLMTLLVVTVLLSIGVSVLNLAIQQVQLATIATDSEIAFHAANAGLECGLYHRRALRDGDDNSEMELGSTVGINCFGNSTTVVPTTLTSSEPNVTGDGQVHQYRYRLDIGSSVGSSACTHINTVVGVADSAGAGITIEGLDGSGSLVPGFPGTEKFCAAGTRCSIISAQGYNRPCENIDTFGTVQREVLLQL